MPEVFFYKMIVHRSTLDSMLREDDIKDNFKRKLAYELAHQLIETNRTKFTFTKNHLNDEVILKAEVRL
jgi:hypothetical protein